ncbi:ABC transporter permease [Rheinheimera riviphila]|uniref:ABC transporter permease n=1 Tax=Rheinheimera riviphila TaxID=1834037 RepID=A0A437R5C0_9GAMM|nr:ABC transporter permease [Rheinheimera riviphila]RVU41964.1 ABC transporter permease [Rheinheimera riviphila]
MHKVVQLIKKDLLLLWREPANLVLILLIPLLMATIFGGIYGNDSHKSKVTLAVVDEDGSAESAAFVSLLAARPDLHISQLNLEAARQSTRLGQHVAYMQIETGFATGIQQFPFGQQTPVIRLVADPKRQAITGYMTGVTMQTVMQLIENRLGGASTGSTNMNLQPVSVKAENIEVSPAMPLNAFSVTVPQAVLWSILASVAIMSAGLATERSQQIMLRLKVTAVSMQMIVLSKILSCMTMILMSTTLLFLFGTVTFDLNIQSLSMLSLAIWCSAFCFAGIIMALGTLGGSPGAISGAVWTVMIIFAMLGGGMVPQFMMPEWLAIASHLSPGKWAIQLMEGAIWRDYSWQDALLPALILVILGTLGCAAGIRNLRNERYL